MPSDKEIEDAVNVYRAAYLNGNILPGSSVAPWLLPHIQVVLNPPQSSSATDTTVSATTSSTTTQGAFPAQSLMVPSANKK